MVMTNPDSRLAGKCNQLRELLPAYAAGLVDAEERAVFEAGLQDCPELMPELQEYADFSDALLFSMPPMPAPSHILDNLMQLTAPAAATAALPADEGAASAVLVPPVRQNPIIAFFKPSLQLRPALVAVLVLMLIGTNLYWIIYFRQPAPTPLPLLVNFAPLDANAQRISFDGGDIAWSKSRAAESWLAVFSLESLEPLPDSTYQLWLVRQDQPPVSAGIFNADETGHGVLIFEFSEPISNFDRLGVTIEPIGGSPAPTGQAVFNGEL